MSRPIDEKLSYFSHDVGLIGNKKFRRLKDKFGFWIPLIYTGLLEIVYRDKGYYIPYETEEEKDDCIFGLLEMLQGRFQPDKKDITEIIEDMVKCGLFSDCHYPKMLTSKRIQETYYVSTIKRKLISIKDDIWMLTLTEMEKLSTKHSYYLNKINGGKNGVIDGNNEDNDSNNATKEEENKKEKQKENEDNEKVSKNGDNAGACGRVSYEQILNDMCVSDIIRPVVWSFVKHCNLNGRMLTNDKLESILVRLDMSYNNDDIKKIQCIKRAIDGGYFDVRV